MTLAGRVSAFFLGWLGLSLIGFAAAIFVVVRADLYGRADERLLGTLETVVAAIEVDNKGIEWEPEKRAIPRPTNSAESVTWLVAVPGGPAIDRAGNKSATDWMLAETNQPFHRKAAYSTADPSGMSWRIARRRLDSPADIAIPPKNHTLAQTVLRDVRYQRLEVVVAIPLAPIHRELRMLAIWLGSLTAGIWIAAAMLGRWLCRRTLAPVLAMATASRRLGPDAPGERLTVDSTGDELEDLGRGFNAALDRLEEAYERQQRFTGDAAHQLRTPLAAMLGQVEVALRRDRDPEEYRKTLRAVGDEVRQLHRVTESLLFLARADADAALPDLQVINLSEWLAAHLSAWRARHPNVMVSVDVGGSSPVKAQPELLAQLVDNLLDNAIKYGPETGPVVVRVQARDDITELSVEDVGSGIAPEDLPHLFDPFFRAASARAAGIRGVGLGLAVALRIATAMSAELTAANRSDHGSRFVVRFKSVDSSESLNSTQLNSR